MQFTHRKRKPQSINHQSHRRSLTKLQTNKSQGKYKSDTQPRTRKVRSQRPHSHTTSSNKTSRRRQTQPTRARTNRGQLRMPCLRTRHKRNRPTRPTNNPRSRKTCNKPKSKTQGPQRTLQQPTCVTMLPRRRKSPFQQSLQTHHLLHRT